jgi:hypothetical protein
VRKLQLDHDHRTVDPACVDVLTIQDVDRAPDDRGEEVVADGLGDCFAIATATSHGQTLLTGDPEILDRPVPCSVEDLRGA